MKSVNLVFLIFLFLGRVYPADEFFGGTPASAILYAQPNLPDDFVFSEALSLPIVSENRAKYAVFEMLTSYGNPANVEFVQVGFIRLLDHHHQRLDAYVSYRNRAGVLTFIKSRKKFGEKGTHTASISSRSGHLRISIDGNTLLDIAETIIFSERKRYFQLVSQVDIPGDYASGMVSKIELNGAPYKPSCGLVDRDVRFIYENGLFAARGRYSQNSPRYFVLPKNGKTTDSCPLV